MVERNPWYDNGVERGWVDKIYEGGTLLYRYTDFDGRVHREEMRDTGGNLTANTYYIIYRYDDEGRKIEESTHDAEMNLFAFAAPYARQIWTYDTDEHGNVVAERHFYDAQDQPVYTREGYSCVRTLYVGDSDNIKRIEYLDADDNRVPTLYKTVPDVACVEFDYLRGVNEIIYRTLRNADGGIIDRIKVSGDVARVANHTTRQYNYAR